MLIPEGNPNGFSHPEQAVQRIQTLLTSANEASDEQLSNAAMDIHPPAVNKMAGLLDLMRKRNAQLVINYQDNKVDLSNSGDIEHVAKRLNPANVEDRTTEVTGTMLGVLPSTRQFELAPSDGPPIQGRVAPEIGDPVQTAMRFSNRQVIALIRTIRISARERDELMMLSKTASYAD